MRKRREIDSIYDSALKYFARYGYKKATLDNIALDLNMTNANLYSYAKNKRQLYCDCVYYAVDEFLSRLKDLLSCIEDPYEKLDFIWDNTLGVILENKNFCEILVADNLSQYATHSDDPWISVNTTFVDFATSYFAIPYEPNEEDPLGFSFAPSTSAEMTVTIYKSQIVFPYLLGNQTQALKNLKYMKNLLKYGLLNRGVCFV